MIFAGFSHIYDNFVSQLQPALYCWWCIGVIFSLPVKPSPFKVNRFPTVVFIVIFVSPDKHDQRVLVRAPTAAEPNRYRWMWCNIPRKKSPKTGGAMVLVLSTINNIWRTTCCVPYPRLLLIDDHTMIIDKFQKKKSESPLVDQLHTQITVDAARQKRSRWCWFVMMTSSVWVRK